MGKREVTEMGAKTSIRVKYKNVDGWHVFTSEDIRGLYVASQDAEKAFRNVGPAIQAGLKLKLGVECEVEQEVSFAEFLKLIQPKKQPSLVSKLIELRDHRFLVCAPVPA